METVHTVQVDDTTVELSIKVSGPPAKIVPALRKVLETVLNPCVASVDDAAYTQALEQYTLEEGKHLDSKPSLTIADIETLWKRLSDGAQKALKEMSTKADEPDGYPKMDLYRKLFPKAFDPARQVSGNLSSLGRVMKSLKLYPKALPYDASGDSFTMRHEIAGAIQRLPLRKP